MRYSAHPIVDVMYRIITSTDSGEIIRENDKVFWARNSRNTTMEVCVFFKIRVYYHVGCIDNKFNIDQVDFEDNLCEHINRDRISIMIAHVLNKWCTSRTQSLFC